MTALVIAVPLLVACLLLGAGPRLPRAVTDAIATAATCAVVALLAVLLTQVRSGRIVTWLGGYHPDGTRALGTVLVADTLNTGLGLLAAFLTGCALLYSWRYFEAVDARYHAMMLLFLTGVLGFLLTGDLFTMFVFFELMSGVAYALTGYRVEEADSVQGALNFGVVNSLGAYFSLMGIGALYAHTGQVGLAQVGVALDGHPADTLVGGAFVLVCTGLLVKAAAVPFHFWLTDAHAVAPTPVCVLFSGIMVELGTYGVLRVYRVAFGGVLDAAVLTRVLLVLGVATAVLGAVLCFTQRHLKRLLAYSTIAHTGLFLGGLAVLDGPATAGFLLSAAAHAGAKGALFLLVGVLMDRYGNVDEDDLFGRAKGFRWEGALFSLAALVLCGLPPFGVAFGKDVTEHAAGEAGQAWLPVVFVLVSVVTGASVLRAGLRVYFGLGSPPREEDTEKTTGADEEPETPQRIRRTPVVMLTAVVLLLASSMVVSLAGGVAGRAGAQEADRAGYLHDTLPVVPAGHAEAAVPAGWTGTGLLLAFASVVAAVALAAIALWRPSWLRPAERSIGVLHRVHSGHVGDYVAWLLAGVTVLGFLVLL
ncbi:complex I subunit 5 family protein [Amycolatopsis sp.]|uniref:complex I subunit 5 family protein n=1 Tax=Amycolatopsis sp. TaxID=37632 RepID=UPI002C4A9F44|nr:complex I subunit 5 family protein [Amycolatopsis sp.]HVV14550.1 complex I subunit 5 family protein [Amycolatopsis sp.]